MFKDINCFFLIKEKKNDLYIRNMKRKGKFEV